MKFLSTLILFVVLSITFVLSTPLNQESIIKIVGEEEVYKSFTIYDCEGYEPQYINIGQCQNVCGTYTQFGISKIYNSYSTYDNNACSGLPVDVQYFQCNDVPPTDMGNYYLNCSNPIPV